MQVVLLGEGRLAHDHGSGAVPVPPGSMRVVAYLALSRDGSVTRDLVGEALWPDTTEDRARRRLSTSLWRLRRAVDANGLPSPVMRTRVDCLRLRDGVEVDLTALVGRVESLLRTPELDEGDIRTLSTAAASLDRELLTGWYDDWIVRARDETAALQIQVLRRIVDWRRRRGELEAAVTTARRLVARAPFDEPAHRLLMTLLHERGDRRGALEHYASCERLLRDELGRSPDEATRRLASQLAHPAATPGSADLAALEARLGRLEQQVAGVYSELHGLVRELAAARNGSGSRPR